MPDRIAIYLRLSKEDGQERDESNSISNQRELIMEYIRRDRKLRKMEVIECKDDGFSGKNMNRPGMEKLLCLVRSREIGVLIVKDLSRFSRDYLVLGQYTEQIFPFMGIRFIAINDHYDSDTCDGGIGEIDVAFKSMLYDFYSEDLSKKIKTAIRIRKEKGSFMNVYAPYGYRKDPNDRHGLVIEPEGAVVIRRIFDEYADGKSMARIAKDLNAEGIAPPSVYVQKRDGRKYKFRSNGETLFWHSSQISRTLKNSIYLGNAVFNKTNMPEPGAGHSVNNPKSEWKYVHDVFPPIIPEELFQKAAERMKTEAWGKGEENKRTDMDGAGNLAKKHYLTGKVICGGCGHSMQHYNAKGYALPGYRCLYRYCLQDRSGCVTSIRDRDLEGVLKSLIRAKAGVMPEIKGVLLEKHEELRKRLHAAEARLQAMAHTRSKIDQDMFRSYENYRSGLTEKETYLQQKAAYEKMLLQISENERKQEKAIGKLAAQAEELEGKAAAPDLRDYLQLDQAFSDIFIKKITVYADRSIDVSWNFQ